MTRKIFTREQLYELVWTTPMLKLSKRFGLSDVGLAKTCRKHDIPLPPPGYWAKVQAGQKPPKTKFPQSEADDRIVLNELSDAELESQNKIEASAEARTPIIVAIADTLRGAHPLVSSARETLAQGKVNDSGIIDLLENSNLNISVSRSQSNRALRLMDAIIKYAVSEHHDALIGPAIKMFGETVPFGIKESTIAIQEEPAKVELKERYEFLHSRYNTRYEPSGKLTLFIDVSQYSVAGSRRQWKDTDNRKIEDCLGKFYEGVIEVATKLRESTEENKRREIAAEEGRKKREIQEKHWAEVRQQQSKEQARLDGLLGQVKSYRLAEDIRAFVEAYRQAKLNGANDQEAIDKIEQWSQWALLHADRFDPTRPSPSSILDERIPEETRRW